jgi:intein/homing endonuclease
MISGMVSGAFAGAAMSMSGNPMFCFVAGTTVLTTLGNKAIETIQVGDTIPCVDHITGEAAEKKVISTTVNKVNKLIELDINGEIIQCTETHPFQVKGKSWVDACYLNPGDVVYTKDWNTATVKSVNLLELDEPVEVFNFEVEDCHTYFVGKTYVLVHNGPCTKVGSGHGEVHHKRNINKFMNKLSKSGDYTTVYGNRSLNTAGLVGNQRPDVIAIDKSGVAHIWEFASKSQQSGSGLTNLLNKMDVIQAANPNAVVHTLIPWF